MSIPYQILKTPHAILTTIAKPVLFPLTPQTLDQIQYLKTCLRKNFEKTRMIGLSAPQVGISKRFFIIAKNLKIANDIKNPVQSSLRQLDVYINPQILQPSQQMEQSQQNCVSSPELKDALVKRHHSIRIKYFSQQEEEIEYILSGFRSIIFQHQLDHLNGITLNERLEMRLAQEMKQQI